MTEKLWLALIISGTILITLFLFRKQISEFFIKIGRNGIDTQFKTHNQDSGAKVNVARNKMLGKRNSVTVKGEGVNVKENIIKGEDQLINVNTNESETNEVRYLLSIINIDKFRLLCQRLHVDYDKLVGSTLDAKIEALIIQMKQEQRLTDLITATRQLS